MEVDGGKMTEEEKKLQRIAQKAHTLYHYVSSQLPNDDSKSYILTELNNLLSMAR